MYRTLVFTVACTVMMGCTSDIAPGNNGSDSGAGSETAETGGPQFKVVSHADGYQQGEVDASNADYIFIDLDNMLQVFPADPEADDEWDLAFEAAAIKVNGGVSGTPPNSEEVYIYADKVADNEAYPWANLATSPSFDADAWKQDESGAGGTGNPNDDGSEPTLAFATYPDADQAPTSVCGDYGWYYYNFFCATPFHAISPRVNVAYVVRSTECRYYRLRMTGYNSADGLSKFPQFDIEEIPGHACNGSVSDEFELPDIF